MSPEQYDEYSKNASIYMKAYKKGYADARVSIRNVVLDNIFKIIDDAKPIFKNNSDFERGFDEAKYIIRNSILTTYWGEKGE